MPTNQTADFFIGGLPYMLARAEAIRGRAWQRTGRSDAPGSRSAAAFKYGALPDEIDHPEVWDDWSGGYGDAYRDPEHPTRIAAAFNMDCRFPRQMVHCQAPRLSNAEDFDGFIETPWAGVYNSEGTLGQYGPLMLGLGLIETPMIGTGGLREAWIGGGTPSIYYRADGALFGSFVYIAAVSPTTGGYEELYEISRVGLAVMGTQHARALTVAGNRLWKAAAKSTNREAIYMQNLALGASPGNAADWSATLAIGEGAYGITTMRSIAGQVFAGGPAGVYAGDSSGTFLNIFPELLRQPHRDNARDMAIHNGQLVIPWLGGVYAYHPSQETPWMEDISPPRGGRGNFVAGQVRAVHSYGRWLYAGLYDGSGSSYLLAGHRGPQSEMIWSPLNKFPHRVRVHRLHVDSVNMSYSGGVFAGVYVPNRIWVATDASIDTSGTAPLYYWPIPASDDNPLLSSPAFTGNYVGSARADMPAVDWGAPSTPKLFRAVEVWADNLLSGYRYGDIYYAVDQGTRYLLGRANTSPKSTMYFPTKAATDEILANGGFEVAGAGGADLWAGWTEAAGPFGSLSDEPTLVHGGSHAAKVYCGHAALPSEIGQFRLPADEGRYHALSFWARGDGVNAGRYSAGKQGVADNIIPVTSTGITATIYAQVAASFITPMGLPYGIELHLMDPGVSGGYCYFDDVSLKRVAGGFVNGQSIALSLESFTASPAITPVYRSLVLRGALRPKSVDTITAVVRVADGMRDRKGKPMRPGATMISELRGFAESGSPQQLIDLSGAASSVAVLQPVAEQEMYQAGEENPEVAATVKMAVLSFS